MAVLHVKKNYKVSTKQLDEDKTDIPPNIRFESSIRCDICNSDIVRKASNPEKKIISKTQFVVRAQCPNGHYNGELLVTY